MNRGDYLAFLKFIGGVADDSIRANETATQWRKRLSDIKELTEWMIKHSDNANSAPQMGPYR